MQNNEETTRKEIQLLTDGKGNSNYCIKAGAGAGKTTLLSKRISRQLVTAHVDDFSAFIRRFVVITYTNTAASELRSKISEELNSIKENGTGEEKKVAGVALSQLDLMQISTIHSFLFDMLREHSFESGVSMDVQMLDDDEEFNRRKNFFDDWYKRHYDDKIIANRMCVGDWITIVANKDKYSETDMERNVYQETFYSLANIRDNIVCDEPLPADEVVRSLEDTARSLFNDLIMLRNNDKDNPPRTYYEPSDNAKERFNKITAIEGLKDIHPLSAEQIDSIIDAYYKTLISSKNKIYEEIANKKINTFSLPDPQLSKYEAIKSAKKVYKKKYDPDIEQDAKDLLNDLILLKDTVKNNPAYKEYKLNTSSKILLTMINKYNDIESKTSLNVYDILRILALYKCFLGIKTYFYDSLKNEDIGFKYPDLRTSEYEDLKNKLDYQRGLRVVKLVLEMQKEYLAKIDSKALRISNDDILYRGKMLLENHPDVLEKLRERYSKIYIDEFQDTTPVQTKIMKMLASKPGTRAEDFNPEDDKLFVVGDPKQSIYRFTGADKSLFENLYDDFENDPVVKTNGQPVELNINYRSNSDIVSWVNNTFDSPAFLSNMKDDDWDVTDPYALHGVFKYPTCDKYKSENDVNAVADLVNDLVGKPYCLLKEGKDKPTRMIKYSDITIIFKKTKNIDKYLKAFTQRSIPISMQGKYTLGDDEILRNFVILLDHFANPKNKAKRVAAAQVLAGVDSVKYEIIKSAQEELRNIRDGIFRRNRMNAATIVQYLLSHEDLFLPKTNVKTKTDTFERWAVSQYMIRLHQMTESCLANNDGDLKTLVDSMYKYLDTEVEHEIELEKSNDAVKLINVHKVKGMSEQIVIIADRSQSEDEASFKGFRGSDGNYYPSATYQNSYNREYFPTFMLNQPVAEEAEKKVKEDLMCLQYVAATRARNALIIMPKMSKSCWFRFSQDGKVVAPGEEDDETYILPDITNWLEDHKATCQAATPDPEPSEAEENKKTLADLIKLKEAGLKLNDAQLISITPSSLEKDFQTGYTKKESGFILEDDRPANSIFGTVMHRTFELIVERRDDITPYNKAEQAECAINQAIIESYDDIGSDTERERYHDYLNIVINDQSYIDKILSIVEGADEVYTEFDFSFFVPDEDRATFTAGFKTYLDNAKITIPDDKTPVWINGQADLVVKKGDLVTVYDYKSDKRNGKPIPDFEDALFKKYEGQLALYRYAIGKSFGLANVKADKDTLIHLYM